MKNTPVVLQTFDLGKRFGALVANNNISLSIHNKEVHAVFGPNGAGKTTFINLLSGELQPTTGKIYFKGRDITKLSLPERARLGIGRTYQITNIFMQNTVFENCCIAAQASHNYAWKIFTHKKKLEDINETALEALKKVGLENKADYMARELSHGEQRQLEIAMVLATGAELLLLDEPLAGMGKEESSMIISLLRDLRASHPIFLIEHDVEAMLSIADVITVMVDGEVIATGSPDEIKENKDVKAAYLGDDL